MNSRKQISKILQISEQYLSMLLSEERKVSWPLAEKLSELFPGKTIQQWKKATSEDLEKAFTQLKTQEKVAS